MNTCIQLLDISSHSYGHNLRRTSEKAVIVHACPGPNVHTVWPSAQGRKTRGRRDFRHDIRADGVLSPDLGTVVARKEGTILFNDTLNTYSLRLNGVDIW